MSMRSIVVGVDGSEKSYRALAFSIGLAQRESAALTVCHVRPYAQWTTLLLSSVAAVGGMTVPPAEPVETAVAHEVTAAAADAIAGAGIDGHVLVSTGDPATELARLARRRCADIVVIGHTRRLRSRPADLARRLTNGFLHGLVITP
ncbi:universal stress protein [Leifsonia sp. F6_8S_P_1B]|uniref:Universal stress protein n=1 Tax=Leifsonia williamsii TaxID=3035919 RepID=A0ABT8K9F8_9MICO|nr:universal stress protein [Leifsonia williamsii]MDN4614080.1 universal stress protein [Leifsonia williamsii]